MRYRAELIKHVEDLIVQKEILVENQCNRPAEKLGTKWYNKGKKSTRYFLITFKELEDEMGNTHTTKLEIEEEICTYYKNLYENYDAMQTLTSSMNMLKTCKESAPGPDDITYNILRKLWNIIGSVLLESWRYRLTIKTSLCPIRPLY